MIYFNKIKYFLILLTLIMVSCDSISNSSLEHKNREELSANSELKSSQQELISSSNSVINGSWVRVGSSGHGKDIAIKDIPYIIGNDNKIYFYNSSTNNWIREPGGGEGKMISYQLNQNLSISPRLYIRGNNNDIYYKERGSSAGWTKVVDYDTRALSTFESTSTSPLSSLTFVGYSNYDPYYGGGQLTQEIPVSPNTMAMLQVEEMAGFLPNNLYASGWIWQDFPCCDDLGDGIFKFNNSENRWDQIDGTAKDIAMGGSQNNLWMIGSNNKIYKRQNNDWVPTVTGTGKRISVSDNGVPFIIGENNKIYKFVEQ